MSNYWDLKCADCGDMVETHANHQEAKLAKLIDRADVLAEVGRAMPELRIELRDEFDIYGEGVRTVPAGWFAKHAGHRLTPWSEYGREPDDCLKDVVCRECDARHDCHMPAGHPGKCSPRRPRK